MTDSGTVAGESHNEPATGQRRGDESVAGRLRALPPELRNAGIASAALLVTVFLPWYEKSFASGGGFITTNLNAFQAFSFIEAAVLLVAVAVLFLVWARANAMAFHLPGGDGTVILAAGAWVVVLLVWRLFDKPSVNDANERAVNVGIQWGIFAAFVAAGALIAAGARVRAVHRPEPPNPAAEEDDWRVAAPRPRRADRRPRDATAVTEAFRDRPSWAGEPPAEPPPAGRRATRHEDPSEAQTRVDPPDDRLF